MNLDGHCGEIRRAVFCFGMVDRNTNSVRENRDQLTANLDSYLMACHQRMNGIECPGRWQTCQEHWAKKKGSSKYV